MIIAGNHDNAIRLQYAASFLELHKIYLSTMPPQNENEHLKKITLTDEYGAVDFYLLPFTKPGYVRHLFDEGVITDYDSAVRALLERETYDTSRRNVLVAHQFFLSGQTQPQLCDSESRMQNIGGLDSVDTACLTRFDYVALGHLHGRQKVGCDSIRYSGSPLKYSVSEQHHTKAVTVATLGKKGELQIDFLAFTPIRDVRQLTGQIEEILSSEQINADDYVSITLTDEESIYRPKDRLAEKFHNILEVRIDNTRTRAVLQAEHTAGEELTPLAAFRQFYQEINGQPLSEEEEALMIEVIDTVTDRQVNE
jgi:exonuclease SbcD